MPGPDADLNDNVPTPVEIRILMVCDDEDYAADIVSDLASPSYIYKISHVSLTASSTPSLRHFIQRFPRTTPIIVIIDFEMLGERVEEAVLHVNAMKERMAVEVIVARAPADMPITQRLRRLGAVTFDTRTRVTAAALSRLH